MSVWHSSINRIAAVLICWIVPLRVLALDPSKPLRDLRYEVWEEAEGLPHYSINAISQGSQGYLWLATYYGLTRFDGERFAVFDQSNTPELANNKVWCFSLARDGTLWIGTASGLVSHRDGVFQTSRFAELKNLAIHSLHSTASGELFIGTKGAGVYILHNGVLRHAGLDGSLVRALLVDRTGAAWAGTNSGLFRRAAPGHPFEPVDAMRRDRVLSLAEDGSGSVYAGTPEGLSIFERGDQLAVRRPPELVGSTVWALRLDRHGVIWIGMFGGGLARLVNGRLERFENPVKFASRNLTALYEDREGNIWVGASGGGLSRLRDVPFTTLSADHGLGGNIAQSVKAARDGTIWVGFNVGGLSHLKSDGTLLRTYTTKDGLATEDVWCLEETPDGSILAGSYGGEITRLARDGKVSIIGRGRGLPGSPVIAVRQDRAGRIWAGTLLGGLAILDGASSRIFTTAQGLSGNQARTFYEDRRGRMWVGTEHGITIFDGGRLIQLGKKDGMPGEFVMSFYEDTDGTMWIGTFDAGLIRYRDGKFFGFGNAPGFPATVVFNVLDDSRDGLWLASSSGIFRLSKRALNDFAAGGAEFLYASAYGMAEGLNSRECNGGQPGGDVGADGRLWFPTMKGLSFVQPASLKTNSLAPPVIIESVNVDGKSFPTRGMIEIPAGSRSVVIDFTGLSLAAPERVQFRYRLDPLDSDWVNGGTRRQISYTHLPPGDYIFRVTAANNDGLWNQQGTSLSIRVARHFYQTLSFVILACLSAAVLAFAMHLLRVRHLRKRNRQLEDRVRERTHTLEEKNNQMSQLIGDLEAARQRADQASQARTQFVANVSHEIRTPMNGILGLVKMALDTPLSREQHEYLRLTEESAEALLHVLNDVLDFSKIDAGHLAIESEPFNLRNAVEDSIRIVTPRASQKNLEMSCSFSADLPEIVSGDSVRLRQVLVNLVSNAVKFTDSGSVRVAVSAERRGSGLSLRFEVRDTGRGIPEAKQAVIFEAFRQADETTTRRYGGTGLGLTICKRLVEAMQGSIGVESRPGEGSCFWFTIAVESACEEIPSGAGPRPLPAELPPLNVLLAEDNHINQKVAVALLGKLGCQVHVVDNGMAAVEAAAARDYDIAFMDVQMPVMDGLLAAAAIRNAEAGTGRRLPIVALTAHAMSGDEQRCLAAGMDAYLSKPIDVDRLASVISRLTALARLASARQDAAPVNAPGS